MAESFFSQDFAGKCIQAVYHYALTLFQFDMDMHSHPHIELMYVASNQCTIHFPGHSLTLKKGELILIDKDIPHQLYVERGKECRVLNLELAAVPCRQNDMLQELFALLRKNKGYQKLCKKCPAFFVVPDDGCNLKQSMDMIQQALHRKTDTDIVQHEISAMIFLLLSLICRRYEETADMKTGISSFVEQALSYIDEHYSEVITVDELAKNCCVSKSHLQRAFRLSAGKTLVQVIQEKRIEKAKILLRSSNLAIIEVAVETGFNNRQHFTETFTKIVGISPSVYRKSKRNMLNTAAPFQTWNEEEAGNRSLSYKGCPGVYPRQDAEEIFERTADDGDEERIQVLTSR